MSPENHPSDLACRSGEEIEMSQYRESKETAWLDWEVLGQTLSVGDMERRAGRVTGNSKKGLSQRYMTGYYKGSGG